MVSRKKVEHFTSTVVCWIQDLGRLHYSKSQEQQPLGLCFSAPHGAFHWTASREISPSIRNGYTLIFLSLPYQWHLPPEEKTEGGGGRIREKACS